MNGKAPHLVQYQGSKRILAPQILSFVDKEYDRFIEPFSGTAATSIAMALDGKANSFLINDLNEPLILMLKEAIEEPNRLASNYEKVWQEQYRPELDGDHVKHFYEVRERFNAGARTPENMLYLLARVVKGAVRYDKNGVFNQSPDKRRHGAKPQTIKKNALAISSLLKGKSIFSALSYEKVLEGAKASDLVYMDPPYQGVSFTRDHRYFAGVEVDDFARELQVLNENDVDFIISYDGVCGEKSYGRDLPDSLRCTKVLLDAGRSAQATMLGRKDVTLEGLYLSSGIAKRIDGSKLEETEYGLLYKYEARR